MTFRSAKPSPPSFQTPTLFSIAQDLSKMEIDVAVGEPDIGSVGRVRLSTSPSSLSRRAYSTGSSPSPAEPNGHEQRRHLRHGRARSESRRRVAPGMTANASVHVAKAERTPSSFRSRRCSTIQGGGGTHRGTRRAGLPVQPAAPQPSGVSGGGGGAGSSPWGQTQAGGAQALRRASQERRNALRLASAGSRSSSPSRSASSAARKPQ